MDRAAEWARHSSQRVRLVGGKGELLPKSDAFVVRSEMECRREKASLCVSRPSRCKAAWVRELWVLHNLTALRSEERVSESGVT